MKDLLSFQSTVPRNYQGTISYEYCLEKPLRQLEITLSYNHEKIQDPAAYLQKYRIFLTSRLEAYLGRKPSNIDLRQAMDHMKTEIQFALFMNGRFVCNIHKPGKTKKMVITASPENEGTVVKEIRGQIRIVVNVFAAIEDDTVITLQVKGE
ncbi:MAG: DUF6669 family protein [Lactimicrobium massiliense]